MKKVTTAIVISAFVIVLGGTAAFAAGYGRQETRGTAGNRQYSTDSACQGTGYHFTDADGYGICDYRDTAGSTGVCPYHEDHMSERPHHADNAGNGAGGGTCFGHHSRHGALR